MLFIFVFIKRNLEEGGCSRVHSIGQMYRFMMERTFFNQLQRQAINMTKRYYQCSGIGVYGYRPKKVEPFERKSHQSQPPRKSPINTVDVSAVNGTVFFTSRTLAIPLNRSMCVVIRFVFSSRKLERSLLFESYVRHKLTHQRHTKNRFNHKSHW